MKKVIIASTNPVKVEVAKKAFETVFPEQIFEFIPQESQSSVSNQPFDEETVLGAYNRIKFIEEIYPDADFYISQEGGLFKQRNKLYNRAYIVIKDKEGFTTESSTASFYLPKKVTEYVAGGMELGDAVDTFFNTKNSKHASGFMGYLTDELVTRTESYLQAALIAVSEQKHKDWY